jgi:transposase InsO family protein
MPWNETNTVTERVKFVLEWEERWNAKEGGRVNVAELCRMYGISRQTGYLWIRRWREAKGDVRALADRSRRPKSNPRAVTHEVEDLVVGARKAHPRWGPVALRQWLVDRHPRKAIPSASCVATILRRRGLITPRGTRRRSRKPVSVTPPFPECTKPNQTWCMDFKGWFRLHTREKCYPFTLLDALSRYLLRCEALLEPDGKRVNRFSTPRFVSTACPTRSVQTVAHRSSLRPVLRGSRSFPYGYCASVSRSNALRPQVPNRTDGSSGFIGHSSSTSMRLRTYALSNVHSTIFAPSIISSARILRSSSNLPPPSTVAQCIATHGRCSTRMRLTSCPGMLKSSIAPERSRGAAAASSSA